MHGGDEKCIQNFLSEDLKGREHLKDLTVDGKMLKW
jgi:hypothetical protein